MERLMTFESSLTFQFVLSHNKDEYKEAYHVHDKDKHDKDDHDKDNNNIDNHVKHDFDKHHHNKHVQIQLNHTKLKHSEDVHDKEDHNRDCSLSFFLFYFSFLIKKKMYSCF